MGRLDGKVAIITGGGTGIGEATALVFAREGAKVVVNGRRPGPLAAVVAKIKAAGGDALAVAGDGADPATIERIARETNAAYGPITTLFNNAAIGDFEPIFHEIEEGYWDDVVRVNLTGIFLLSKAILPQMIANGGGSIINNGSRLGLQGGKNTSVYTATKGAVFALTRSMAVEYAEHGIRVNSISPGLVITPMTEGDVTPYLTGELPMWPRAPLGRLGDPLDIANGALYLASDESAWVTGITLPIDGGRGIL